MKLAGQSAKPSEISKSPVDKPAEALEQKENK
jgi:hypothetical protein